ncbi:7102_t:CDS:2 [Entrophospora sp. SA101]|nr:7102_t:CDS:2 [Entrophospora sp. SA101]
MSKTAIATAVSATEGILKTTNEAAVVTDLMAPFLPLISEVGAIVVEIIDLYQTAEHNKRICGSLLSRVTTAQNAVNTLKIRRLENEDLFKSKEYYKNLQKLVNVIRKIQKFIADVSQLKGLRKFMLAHSIEDEFKRLTEEFDELMRDLNFSLAIQIQIQIEDDNKALRKDIQEMANYLHSIEGGITDNLSQINDKLDDISQLNILWQKQLLNSDEGELESAMIPYIELQDPARPVRHNKVIKKVRLGQDVAIKAKAVSKEDDKKDILGQVIILKKLKESQYICQFYGVSHDGDIMYLVTEWCEFGNLSDYYKSNGPLNWHRKSQLAVDIARGLTFLHAVSILHHDIRSENILITNHHQAKIANFTLSRGFDDATKNITPTIDNVRWMAPEKLKNKNSPYTAKCEIYSFGMLLWEIAEEKTPFQNETDILKIVNNIIEKIRPSFSHGVPIEWTKLVYQALAWKAFKQHSEDFDEILAKYWMGYYLYYDLCPIQDKGDNEARQTRLKQAVQLFKEAADASIADAQLRYGHCLWAGDGVKKNIKQSVEYFQMSANNGNITAMYNLGNIYHNGLGVVRDEEKGKRYLKMAALQQHPKALSMCKSKGISLT